MPPPGPPSAFSRGKWYPDTPWNHQDWCRSPPPFPDHCFHRPQRDGTHRHAGICSPDRLLRLPTRMACTHPRWAMDQGTVPTEECPPCGNAVIDAPVGSPWTAKLPTGFPHWLGKASGFFHNHLDNRTAVIHIPTRPTTTTPLPQKPGQDEPPSNTDSPQPERAGRRDSRLAWRSPTERKNKLHAVPLNPLLQPSPYPLSTQQPALRRNLPLGPLNVTLLGFWQGACDRR